MTFEYSRTVTTSAAPAAVWALWSDPPPGPSGTRPSSRWPSRAHFGEGAGGTMVLAGGIEVPVTLEVVEPGRRYLDRLSMGDLVIEIDHVVEPHAEGAEVTVSTVITGPGAEDIGPMVTNDAPKAMHALTVMAEGRA